MKRVSSVKRKGLPLTGGDLKLRCKAAAAAGQACDSGMANKENELASSEDMWGIHYNDKCAPPLTSGETSKMAGVGSKCSDSMAQVRTHSGLRVPTGLQRFPPIAVYRPGVLFLAMRFCGCGLERGAASQGSYRGSYRGSESPPAEVVLF